MGLSGKLKDQRLGFAKLTISTNDLLEEKVGKVEGKSNSIYYPYVPDHSTLASRVMTIFFIVNILQQTMFVLGHQWINSERKVMVGSGDQNFESWMRSMGKRTETVGFVQCSALISSLTDAVENFNHYSEVGAGSGTE
ncbi:hypothetical protein Bca52824_037383 [Brassica carinata]|uniref:Uncharacterized protein n=1 Tax=Brassica carinata TaxID=52824 RepID=A0A8X7S7D4_BRACI|nr:hypothetical protein Bca52824_037383 [Brassica carinata]